MKIHYKINSSVLVVDTPSIEPDEPVFLRDLSEELIFRLVKCIDFNCCPEVLDILLPEQIWVLRCHASFLPSFVGVGSFFIDMRQEILQLAKQEIEPGMFKDDTL
ncbi:MAG: hypothetical protein ACXACY_19025 [Candidatus Hodarchaeales archaeon]|jgi:hypothetical protein